MNSTNNVSTGYYYITAAFAIVFMTEKIAEQSGREAAVGNQKFGEWFSQLLDNQHQGCVEGPAIGHSQQKELRKHSQNMSLVQAEKQLIKENVISFSEFSLKSFSEYVTSFLFLQLMLFIGVLSNQAPGLIEELHSCQSDSGLRKGKGRSAQEQEKETL